MARIISCSDMIVTVDCGRKFKQFETKIYLFYLRYFRQGTLLHNYGDVLAILMRLRQLCCHPFLVAKAAEVVKETLGKYCNIPKFSR